MGTFLEENELYIGLDDGMFLKEKSKWTVLVGVLFVKTKWTDTALTRITVDGLDGTASAERLINRLLKDKGKGVIFLDGVTYAGFNLIDPAELAERTGLITISIFRKIPNENKILKALRLHFTDWETRWKIISNVSTRLNKLTIRGRTIYFYSSSEEGRIPSLIRKMAILSKIPEPLRIADMLAKEIGRLLVRYNKE